MLTFLKNIKKDTCSYHYQNLDDMIYSSQCAPPPPPLKRGGGEGDDPPKNCKKGVD